MKYTYLVTGADGHLGSWIIKKLLKKGESVRGLRLFKSPLKTPIIEQVFYGDITKIETLYDFFDVENAKVIHTASIVDISKNKESLLEAVNIKGSLNILKLCKEKNFSLTYISSVHAFVENQEIINENSIIDPNLVKGKYAQTKAFISNLFEKEKANIPINIIFPSGILGPKDFGKNPLNTVVNDYLNNKLFCYIEGGYDMVDVRDVAQIIVKINQKDITNENFIISNSYVQIKDFFSIISQNYNNKIKPIKMPLSLAKIISPICEIYYNILKKPALLSSYSLYTLTHSPKFSHEKATKLLNYKPRAIEKTIKNLIKQKKNKL